MFIALIGDPLAGFTVCGPFPSGDAIDANGDAVDPRSEGYWSVELNTPSTTDANIALEEPMTPDAGYDANGTAVAFSGDITGDWHTQFFGPFKNIEAARKWCAACGVGTDCAIELRPVPLKKAA
jgi:hypothetical protein